MTFGERIKLYIKFKGISVRAFEMQSNLKNGAIYRVIKNSTSLNGDSIAAIGMVWKDLDLNWLMTGEGEMLLEPNTFKDPPNEYNKELKAAKVNWYKDSLRRADETIELQKEIIANLRKVIEKQKKAAKDAGIDL